MTSISGSFSTQRPSPRDMMQDRLTDAISSGSISASDKDALTSALDDIDKSLPSQAAAGTGRPDPKAMKAKIDSLIDQEVKSGKLTDDQASELKQLFAKGPGGKGGPGGPGGPGGAGGPRPDEDTSSTDESSDTDQTTKLLQDFMKLLKEKQSSGSSYGSSGSQDLQSVLKSLLVDTSA
ncbi:hypothetical protein [uncultured Alsobacter sp.]|uniref:hypothetical protein n=1 Tax=uncultured Alsobacter sp. TaxID=1748258 RepID=UPI0025E3D991|nr:hypothetical protein [uncultured Alsobacter sp.]